MVGRGAVADPALLRKLRGGPAATREELEDFTGELYQAYQDFLARQATRPADEGGLVLSDPPL